VDWIRLTQYRDQCRALVDMSMNLWFAQNRRGFWGRWKAISFCERSLLNGLI